MPGDKSISHRGLMFAALARGESRIVGGADSADCRATERIVQALGVEVRHHEDGSIEVTSPGRDGWLEPTDVLDAANSGTTTRLMCGLLSTTRFFSILTGDASLRSRPMARVLEPLRGMGAEVFARANGSLLPIAISGRPLQGIDYTLPIASAQVKSALLLAGLAAEGQTRIVETTGTRDHTERLLEHLGVPIHREGGSVAVEGGSEIPPFVLTVPGDISSAAPFIAAALIAPESKITVENVGINSTRTGFLDILQEMGGAILVETGDDGGLRDAEPRATLTIRSSPLQGAAIGGTLIPRLVDELPLLALVATQACGRTTVRDAAELRAKESDRIRTTVIELRRLGATIDEVADGFTITGPSQLRGAPGESHGDHRIAMMLAVASLVADGETTIDGTACVDVSYPGFFEAFMRLRAG